MTKKEYKILIADDEYWTREKLRTMIDWEEYDLHFLEPAKDGEEVLNRIPAECPDILITDINMPFVNGVELVEQVREKYPDVVVFVISGYDDFAYVKSTLVAGAINYLLKPVSKIDLINALTKAMDILAEREQDRREIDKASSLIEDRELSALLEREESPFVPAVPIETMEEKAGYSVMLVKLHSMSELMKQYDYDRTYLSSEIKKKLRQILQNNTLLIFNHIYRSNEFVIISQLDDEEQYRMASKILTLLENAAKGVVSITISEPAYSIESIHSGYIQCVSLFMTRPYEKKSVIIRGKKQDDTGCYLKSVLTDEMTGTLKRLMKSGDAEKICTYVFEKIGIADCTQKKWEYIHLKQAVKKICNLFMDEKAEKNNTVNLIDLEEMVEMIDKIMEGLEAEPLCEALREFILSAMENDREKESGSIRQVVKEAVQYVNDHYVEELSLTFLAEHFGVESSYFSRMFRQETGTNLMLYIAQRRIEKAKQIMRDESVSLAEVAFRTGYDDYTYFNRVFKKMTGYSPREYRAGI
ncbi:MAG: response regulator [Lachnospiraceae bacterium]|nr:response regulator [Lachnospiraceae bacterium]